VPADIAAFALRPATVAAVVPFCALIHVPLAGGITAFAAFPAGHWKKFCQPIRRNS
jgi:hypothetical protein